MLVEFHFGRLAWTSLRANQEQQPLDAGHADPD
jgi:hypothetical protein